MQIKDDKYYSVGQLAKLGCFPWVRGDILAYVKYVKQNMSILKPIIMQTNLEEPRTKRYKILGANVNKLREKLLT